MSSSKITAVRIIDPRIQPQPNPTYAANIPPDQCQWYKIPASGFSNNSINFNGLTTLGKDRAYLDTFELGITATITFTTSAADTANRSDTRLPPHGLFMPQSFPFNTVCDQVQININGGSFFNAPNQVIRARERYWEEQKLHDSYGNICPCSKPLVQDEMGINDSISLPYITQEQVWTGTANLTAPMFTYPSTTPYVTSRSRMISNNSGNAYSSTGAFGPTNFDILQQYDEQPYTDANIKQTTLVVTWREPIMCAPFSSRYDATYGRPLYNITSIDMQFKMLGSLKNMFLCIAPANITDWTVNLTDVQLYYQVMTVTAPIEHDMTVVPYRRFVPYVTNGSGPSFETDVNGTASDVKFTSGVYTLTEVPTAIWVYAAPTPLFLQQDVTNGSPIPTIMGNKAQTTNKLFGFLKHINISCGNTTQILDTARVPDLYRIAKSNGCQDNFRDWALAHPFQKRIFTPNKRASPHIQEGQDPAWQDGIADWSLPLYKNTTSSDKQDYTYCSGPGSVLRLIPGVDIVLPDRRLIPGTNANNMVFQIAEATYDFQYAAGTKVPLALWVIFEYVGVATITPGNCSVSMAPLTTGNVVMDAPMVSAANNDNTYSTTEGSGWWDKVKSFFSKASDFAKDTKILSTLLPYVPVVGPTLAKGASALGYGEDGVTETTPLKRPRKEQQTSAGAILGLGDFC